MNLNKSISSRIFDTCNIIFLTLLAIVAFYPFWYVICVSFSDPGKYVAFDGVLLKPVGFSLESYKAVFSNKEIFIGYRNTIFYVVGGTALNIFMTCLAAYGLSRKDFLWKKLLTTMIVITMFFGGGLIPNFLLVKRLGLLDNPLALMLPGAISTYNLMILKTSFSNLPAELEDAAKIDGANDFIILFRFAVPLCFSTIAVLILYYAVGHWNSWFSAMIYFSKRDLYPLQLFLREILISNNTNNMTQDIVEADKEYLSQTIQYATIIVATLPILVIYPIMQRYFVKGVMIGAVKG